MIVTDNYLKEMDISLLFFLLLDRRLAVAASSSGR